MEILSPGTRKFKNVYDVYIVNYICNECGQHFAYQTGEYLYTRLKEKSDDGGSTSSIWLTCPFCGKYHNNYDIDEANPTLHVTDRSKVVNYIAGVNKPSWAEVTAEDYGAGGLYLNPTSRTVKNNVTSVTFNVVAMDDSLEWDISKSESWMNRPSPSHNTGTKQVTVTFDANNNKKKTRTGYYYVDYGQFSKKFTLTQLSKKESETEGKIPLSVTPDSITVESYSGLATFTVACDVKWIVEKTDTGVHWVDIYTTDNTQFTIKYGQNIATSNRSTKLRVKGKTEETVVVEVEITQVAAGQYVNTLLVDPSVLNIDADGNYIDPESNSLVPTINSSSRYPYFNITSDTSWVVTVPDWITNVTPSEGTGDSSVYLLISANPESTERDDEIVVEGRDAETKKVLIKQKAGSVLFDIIPTGIAFKPEGGSSSFLISTEPTTTWKVYTNDSWISLDSPTEGEGSKIVTVSVGAEENARVGLIYVRNTVVNIEKVISVYQQENPPEPPTPIDPSTNDSSTNSSSSSS